MRTQANPSAGRSAATLHEVARRASVAASTAAEILRSTDKSRYSDETRKRVLWAARALNYVPNSAAKALASRSTRTVGVILQSPVQSDADRFIHMGSRYTITLDAINYALDAADYNLMVGSAIPSQSEKSRGRFSRFMREQHADGILVFFSPSDQLRDELERLNMRYVVIEGHEDEPACHVSDDEEAVGYMAAEHLLSLGHTRIAFINAEDRRSRRSRPRQRGYLKALTGANCAPMSGWDEYLPLYKMLDRVLEKQIPTALIAYDESDALMTIKYLGQRGLNVPADISVVALTDQKLEDSFGNIFEPSLTMLQTDLRGMGSAAVHKLLEIIQTPEERPASLLLKPTLKIGKSTAPAKPGERNP